MMTKRLVPLRFRCSDCTEPTILPGGLCWPCREWARHLERLADSEPREDED
jgi:hypothetical protein